MKKMQKLLAALLAVMAVGVSAIGLTACDQCGVESSGLNSSKDVEINDENSFDAAESGTEENSSVEISSDEDSISEESSAEIFSGESSLEDSSVEESSSAEDSEEDSSSKEIMEEEGSVGLLYTLSDNYRYYTVAGIGECTDTELIIPSTYEGLPVTSIGERAFEYCSSLTEVVIGNSVTSIGGFAFYNCSSLTEVVIGDSVTSIGDYAFYECSSLAEVVIPDSVTSIGYDAFDETGYYNDVKNWDNGTLYIGNHLIQVTDDTTCEYSVEIKKGTICIADVALSNCNNMIEVSIPDSVITIGDGAFDNCDNLTKVVIPDSVTSIGERAFWYCSSLTEIVIPDSVTSIGYDAFDETGYYNDVKNWEDDVLYIGRYLIKARYLEGEYEVKEDTLCIAGRAFYQVRSLTSVIIPDSVKGIGYEAFYVPYDRDFSNHQGLISAVFKNTKGWVAEKDGVKIKISSGNLSNTSTAAYYLKDDGYYSEYVWVCEE